MCAGITTLELWKNEGVRGVAVLLVLTLTGPSVGALLCDWTCATQHVQASSRGGCHEQTPPVTTPAALETAHRCHDLAAPAESILTSTPNVEIRAIVVADVPGDVRASTRALSVIRSSSSPHAPPSPLIPLRI